VIHDAIAIIPARGGSVRIPRKNIKRFHGKPIIAYSIATARKAGISRIIVSTDDADIAAWAKWYRCEVHQRCHDDGSRGTQDVVREALEWLNTRMPHTVCIYPTAPLMLPSDLQGGFDMLMSAPPAPFVYSVCPFHEDAGQWYWGYTDAFLSGTPLEQAKRYMLPIERVCDINTPDDWEFAEKLYANMKGIK